MALVKLDRPEKEIGFITLNDPDNLNAMSEEMAQEFKALVAEIAKGDKPRVLILTGAGRAFSAGGHLDMLEKKTELTREENYKRMMDFYHAFLSMLTLDIPVIAAVNGHAIGAGLCIAAACDIRIVSETAKLGLTFTKLGLHPGMGATYFLPRIIGQAQASELMMTGRVIDSAVALKCGLVSRVVAVEDVIEESMKVAREIASCGPLSVRQLTRSLRGDPEELERALKREAECQAENYASAEFKEGVRAAIEKRAPSF
ncbi:MAG: enoyl-CoA hydratase/isomerase family protein [Candidatus Dadabacteria bacterium]|nr:MAG: enoyl-CoA hydratase/isomerase family protein [Candidatus Dadabacteria bacterium]